MAQPDVEVSTHWTPPAMVASKGDPLMAPIAFDLHYPQSRFVQCGTTEVAYAC